MTWTTDIGIQDFLSTHSSLRISNLSSDSIEIMGQYELIAQYKTKEVIEDTFELRVVIHKNFLL